MLTLAPGVYTFSSVTLGARAEIQAADTTLVIDGVLDVGKEAAVAGTGSEWWVLAPDDGSQPAATLGMSTVWDGRLVALGGTVQLDQNVEITGQIVAQIIEADRDATIMTAN